MRCVFQCLLVQFSLIITFISGCVYASPDDTLRHLDTSLSLEARTQWLIDQMTPQEKISQLTHDAVAIPRLKVPRYNWWNESLHGVAFSGKATVFPQPIGLGASFNPELANEIGMAISDEARAKHHHYLRQGKREIFQGLTFFSPNINIFRDPRWGRGSETYGEDPYLTGRLGVAHIKGLQGDDDKYLKLVATAKHYAVHSGPEATRHSFNSVVNDKDLYETYLPHFKEAVQEAGVYSVMGAYNRVNGASASGDPRLLNDILREEWGFTGYVVSDCWAVLDIYEYHKLAYSPEHATEIAIKSGNDVNCGSYYKNHLLSAYKKGMVSDDDLDRALYRAMLARFKLGMFDPEDDVPFSSIPTSVINSEKHQALALHAAQESMVLLKNDHTLLPIDLEKTKKIAVIGPNADQIEALLGNYHGLPFQYSTPLKGIQDHVSNKAQILYAPGSNWSKNLPILNAFPDAFLSTTLNGKTVEGLTGEYFSNKRLEGNPDGRVDQESAGANVIYEGKPKLIRHDKKINFNWDEGSPDRIISDDFFSVRWRGFLTVDEAGDYLIGAEGHNKYKVYIDDALALEHYEGYHENIKVSKKWSFEKNKRYNIKIEFEAHTGAANFRLMWAKAEQNLLEEALKVAEASDVVVLFAGLTPRLEAEGADRSSIELPDVQQVLIKKMVETGKPVVLVLLNGGHLAINWEKEHVPAILEAWYPGQAGGEAIASILFGKYNPSGRLPITFVKSLDELPHFGNYAMKGRTYRYSETEPLFPFGYGLSYSVFKYDNFSVPKKIRKNKNVPISVQVTNTSDKDGEEVVQVYVSRLGDLPNQPIRSLKAVKKIKLNAHESKKVHFELPPEAFGYYDENGQLVIEKGAFELSVGGGQYGLSSPTTQVVKSLLKVR